MDYSSPEFIEYLAIKRLVLAILISQEEGDPRVISPNFMHNGFRASIIRFLRGESDYNDLIFHMLLFNHTRAVPWVLNLAIVFVTPAYNMAIDEIEQYEADMEEILCEPISRQLGAEEVYSDQIRDLLIEVFAEDEDEEDDLPPTPQAQRENARRSLLKRPRN